MRIITIESKDQKAEKDMVDKIENFIGVTDPKGKLDINYLVDE